MERLRSQQHHVVGDVDDVVDGALAGRHQACLEPRGGRTDLDVLEDARREARAELGDLDRDRGVVGHVVAAGGLGVLVPGRRCQLGARDGVELAGNSVHPEAVDPVRGRLQLDHRLGDRKHLGEGRAGVRDRVLDLLVPEHDDPRRIVAQRELRLRQDHPVRLDPAELRLAERRPVRQHRSGERHRDRLPAGDIGGAADDRPGAVAGVDLADPEPVGVRVLLHREHAADHEALWRADAGVADPLDLDRVHRELVRDVLHGEVGVAVRAEPAQRGLHRNCSNTRTSFSKNLRRSGTPCLSCAIRSIPMPKAKPCTRSGS